MTDKKRLIPPHANEEPHKRFMERVSNMTPQEFFQTTVDAGIYHEDGTLTKEFGGPPNEE